MEQRDKKKFEFSKLIVVLLWAVVIAITAFTCYMIYDTKDLSPLTVLIPAIFTAFSAGTVGYYAKAKAENVVKLSKTIKEEKIDVSTIKVANSIMNGNEIADEIPSIDMSEIQG